MFREIKSIFEDSFRNIVAFLVMTMSAIILHFVGHQLEEWHFPRVIVGCMYVLEMVIFFSDFLLLFLTVVKFTCKEAHKLLMEMGVDVPKLLRNRLSRTGEPQKATDGVDEMGQSS